MVEPAHPVWLPETEAELQRALDRGLLEEDHHLELKALIPEGHGRNARVRQNLETARDLASLAVDGGRLIVGVDEGDEDTPPSLCPVALGGLAERLEHIALARINPPLELGFYRLPAESGEHHPSVGYLLVEVPVSPQAPHMVDGSYWGRGEKTKQSLADAEVERLMRRRQQWEQDILALLDDEIARDPIPEEHRAGGHLFLVAEPVAPRAETLAPLFGIPDWHQKIRSLLVEEPDPDGPSPGQYEPHPSHLGWPARRELGAAVATGLKEDRTPETRPSGHIDEPRTLELEVYEHGGLRLFCGRGTDTLPRSNTKVVFEGVVLGLVHYLLGTCDTVGRQAGYRAGYDLAVGLTDLGGAKSDAVEQNSLTLALPYTADTYRRSTRASAQELASRPRAVVSRLVGPLLRTLGSAPLPVADWATPGDEPAGEP